ncbi:MAG: hypothetical protein ABIK09_20495 [Pseudomonadota bacterium]
MRSMLLAAVLLVIIIVFVVTRGRRGPKAHAMLRRAGSTDDLEAVIRNVASLSTAARSLFYQRAINDLWGQFRRDLAVHLIRAFAAAHSSEKIAQYWLKQALEVEPALAQKALDEDFLKVHYRPTVAKQCGLTGS